MENGIVDLINPIYNKIQDVSKTPHMENSPSHTNPFLLANSFFKFYLATSLGLTLSTDIVSSFSIPNLTSMFQQFDL